MSTLELGDSTKLPVGSNESIQIPDKVPSEELVSVDPGKISDKTIKIPDSGTVLMEDALMIESSVPIEIPDKVAEEGVILLDTIKFGQPCYIGEEGPLSGCCEYTNPNPVMVTVGGIEAGETFFYDGKDFRETMNALFYPTMYPDLVDPSSSFSSNSSSLYEIGDSITINFTASFDRGSISINGSFQNYRSGLPNTYNYAGEGLPSTVSSTVLDDYQNVSITVSINYSHWRSSVSYDEGPQPLDSEGNDYGSPLPAGTTSEKIITIEGVYPLFGTTSDITVLTKQPLYSMISANNIEFSMVPETGGNKQTFEIPSDWLSSRPLSDIETYNTLSGKWESTGISQWDISDTTETIQGSSVNYKRYVFNGPDRSSILIRLIF